LVDEKRIRFQSQTALLFDGNDNSENVIINKKLNGKKIERERTEIKFE
jgi:hypothetical protein